MIKQEIIEAIEQEIAYAQGLGPDRVESQERPHSTGEYVVMLQHYINEAVKNWTLHGGDTLPLHDVRKIAAIAIRCMNDCGVKRRDKAT